MIKLKEIRLGFVEGLSDWGNQTFKSFEAFQAYMGKYARYLDCPDRKWLGYYKSDVTVEWEDGESWSDRYDMGQTGLNDEMTLAQTIRHYNEFYNGRKPHWMKQEDYDSFLLTAQFYRNIVENYQLDD